MASATKVIAYSALTVFGLWGLSKLLKAGSDFSNFADTFGFEISVKKPTMQGITLTIPVNVSVINPTDASVSFIKPYVEIYFTDQKGRENKVATSEISRETVTIEPARKNPPIRFNVEVSLLSVVTMGADIVQTLIEGVDWSKADEETVMKYATKIFNKMESNMGKIWPRFSVKVLTEITKLKGAKVSVPLNKKFSLE